MRFLEKLRKENKIKIIEPNKNIAKAYKIKSDNSLRAANLLLKEGLYEESIVFSYYSMYLKSLSYLVKEGIRSETHQGTILLLKEKGMDTRRLEKAKDLRIEKQYFTDSHTNKELAREIISDAEIFISEIETNE